MRARTGLSKLSIGILIPAAIMLLTSCATIDSWLGRGQKLSGSEEVPPVKTGASGSSQISVKDDRTVSGSVSVSDMKPTAAHIHEGAPGKNGPVIIPLTKASDTSFNVPAKAKLTEAQYKAYKAGNLYVNVHSAAHPGGEVRAQLKP